MERDALLATVDQLGLDRFDLAGWSSGGGVALAFAMRHPDRIRTLTLIEPGAMWVLRETGHMTDAFRQLEAFDRSLAEREVTIDDLKAFLVNAGLGPAYTGFESHPRWPVWVRNRQALAAGAAEWQHQESLADLRSLHVPILMVKGTETAGVLAAMVDDIVANAPNVTLLELPGSHACFLEHPEEFREAFEAHMAKGAAS
jgi:pimeloyl-ACP methyl ester carboxylesterase